MKKNNVLEKNIFDALIINKLDDIEIIMDGKEYKEKELPSNRLKELNAIEDKIIDEEFKIEEGKNSKDNILLAKLYQKKDKIMESCYRYFGITKEDNTIDIDCIKKYYELKNNQRRKSKLLKGNFLIKEKVCIKSDRLLLCDGLTLMEIPLTYIGEVQEIKRKVIIRNWDEKENINSTKYQKHVKKSLIKSLVKIDKYYKVIVGDKYLLIPSYDIEHFKQFLNNYIQL